MRIVAFGCSYTYGHALPDCIEGEFKAGAEPSKYAWPQLLADHYVVPCENQGKCGGSNKEIWYRAINFPYQKNDIVLILWSHFDRFCVFMNCKKIHVIGPWLDNDKKTKGFYKHMYTERDAEYDFLLRANHLKAYLDRLGIINFQMLTEPRLNYDEPWNLVKFIDINFLTILRKYPRALDGKHPGIEAHQKIAEILKHHIKL